MRVCKAKISQMRMIPGNPMISGGFKRVTRVCGLPSGDRDICPSCEDAVHVMADLQAEAIEMDECRNYLMGDEGALDRANEMASNRGAW